MSESSEPGPGVWSSLKRLLDTLLATVQNRVELLVVELQEEKCRLLEALLWAAALITFGLMSLWMVTFTVVVLFWENGRLAALVSLSVLYLAGTVLAWRGLRTRMKARSAFAGTIDELKKDRVCLRNNN